MVGVFNSSQVVGETQVEECSFLGNFFKILFLFLPRDKRRWIKVGVGDKSELLFFFSFRVVVVVTLVLLFLFLKADDPPPPFT